MTARMGIRYDYNMSIEIARINLVILIKRGFEANCHAQHIIEIKYQKFITLPKN